MSLSISVKHFHWLVSVVCHPSVSYIIQLTFRRECYCHGSWFLSTRNSEMLTVCNIVEEIASFLKLFRSILLSKCFFLFFSLWVSLKLYLHGITSGNIYSRKLILQCTRKCLDIVTKLNKISFHNCWYTPKHTLCNIIQYLPIPIQRMSYQISQWNLHEVCPIEFMMLHLETLQIQCNFHGMFLLDSLPFMYNTGIPWDFYWDCNPLFAWTMAIIYIYMIIECVYRYYNR